MCVCQAFTPNQPFTCAPTCLVTVNVTVVCSDRLDRFVAFDSFKCVVWLIIMRRVSLTGVSTQRLHLLAVGDSADASLVRHQSLRGSYRGQEVARRSRCFAGPARHACCVHQLVQMHMCTHMCTHTHTRVWRSQQCGGHNSVEVRACVR